jgi:hypothetical protein
MATLYQGALSAGYGATCAAMPVAFAEDTEALVAATSFCKPKAFQTTDHFASCAGLQHCSAQGDSMKQFPVTKDFNGFAISDRLSTDLEPWPGLNNRFKVYKGDRAEPMTCWAADAYSRLHPITEQVTA